VSEPFPSIKSFLIPLALTETASRRSQLTSYFIIGAVFVVGTIAIVTSTADLIRHPVSPTWLVFVGLTVVTGWSTLRMRRAPISFSISDTFTIASALLFGPSAGTILAVFDAIVMSVRVAYSGVSGMAVRAVFNVAASATAMWVSAHLFFALSGSGPLGTDPGRVQDVVLPLAIFAGLYFALNTGLVAVAVGFERRAPVVAMWKAHLRSLWLTYIGGASIAGVLVMLTASRILDIRTVVLIVPLLFVLHVTYKAALDRAEEQLAHVAQITLYAAALRSTVDAVIVTDRGGSVTFINAAAEQLLGCAADAVVGQRVLNVVRTIDPETREPDGEHRRPDGSVVQEHILVRRDGVEVAIEDLEADIRDRAGAILGTVRTIRDITRRKAIDRERDSLLLREREARETADAASRLKDEFLATVSHELRTPATGILGWARLLKTGRLDPAQTRQALDALERGARAQARLLDDLLDMSRIVRGALRIELEPTDVSAVLHEAVETVMPTMRAKGIRFSANVASPLPWAYADPVRLRQVLWNLLSNAVKFTDAGGMIGVSAGTADADHLRIEISDSGHGIDPDVLPFIFDRFRQADGSTTRRHGGLGLGLAIVRHLIELHGGTVTAESEGRGRGARFQITLRIASASHDDGRPAAA